MNHPTTRNTLYVEQGKLILQNEYAAQQYYMRIHAPDTARHAKPGHFIHIQCSPSLSMRRPMSIMRSNPVEQTVDILYKVHGQGTDLLSRLKTGDEINLIGPIGQSFKMQSYKKRPLLVGGGVGIPPMVFLAEHIKNTNQDLCPLVIMGSEIPFPFKSRPSQIMLNEMPAGIIACMPLLDDQGIPSRLTSLQDYPGCFNGYVTDLVKCWLDELDEDQLNEVELFSCGPIPMLRTVTRLAREYKLPCQISLEEYMACAVGGCAGCTILIDTDNGPAMKRICVDGPVFEAQSVIRFREGFQ